MHSVQDLLDKNPTLQWIEAWRASSGPLLAKKATFLGVHRRADTWVLLLDIADPVWRQEIQFQKETLIEIFNRELKKRGVSKNLWPSTLELGSRLR